MPAARITLPHLSVYATMNWLSSVGEIGNGSTPKSARRALNVGSRRAAFTSLLIMATTSGGVCAGAPTPSQLLASYPGTNSPIGGIFGKTSNGVAVGDRQWSLLVC